MKNSRRRRKMILDATERLMEDKYDYKYKKLSDIWLIEHAAILLQPSKSERIKLTKNKQKKA